MKQRKNTVTLALCQMHVKAGRVAENIRTAESMIVRAAKRGADLAVLPEMWPTGFDFSRMDEYRRSAELKGLSKRASQLAESLKVHLAAGSWLHRVGPDVEDRPIGKEDDCSWPIARVMDPSAGVAKGDVRHRSMRPDSHGQAKRGIINQ